MPTSATWPGPPRSGSRGPASGSRSSCPSSGGGRRLAPPSDVVPCGRRKWNRRTGCDSSPPMIELGARFLLAALVIAGAGTALARSADRIADRTGYGRLLVGSVLLAVATSLPEMLVDWSAVRLGEVDLAVGDLMGSNLMNLLIL